MFRESEDTKSTKGHEEREDKNIGKSIAFDDLSGKVIGLAIEVHRELGPGLLENTYKQCLAYELNQAKIHFNTEVELPLRYKEICIPYAYRIDLLVENQLIVELKCIDKFHPVHEAQILTYMKFTRIEVGLLINFNEKVSDRFWTQPEPLPLT